MLVPPPLARRSCVLVSLLSMTIVADSGCSFLDDFDRYHELALDGGANDASASVDTGSTLDADSDTGLEEDAALSDAQLAPEAAIDAGCPLDSEPRALRAGPLAVELARLRAPVTVKTRILGPSAWLGASRLWTFTQTALVTPEVALPADRPVNHPSAARDGRLAPWVEADPNLSWQLDELLGLSGNPLHTLALFPEEQNMDVSLSILSLIRDPNLSSGGLAFAVRSPGFFKPADSVWVARIDDGAAVARRDLQPLFRVPEPLFGLAAYSDAEHVNLLACKAQPASEGQPASYPCLLARAPLAMSSQRAAYRVFVRDPQGVGSWSADLTQATPLFNGSDTSLSLSWNPYLKKFLVVHSGPFRNTAVLQTAASLEGPWTERTEVQLSAPLFWIDLHAREHPSVAQQCGKRIIVSHWSPTDGAAQLPSMGDIVLSAIDLE